MRSIPYAMQQKLQNRFKAASTQSEPHIRVVATQTSTNILLTEPIHTNTPVGFGDVALRQTAEDEEISLAYAVCVDEGIATVYRRNFPATMDYEWELSWVYGEAADAAIEFDGTWKMDGSRKWYYLETESYPYLFTVEDGDLYVQKWRDTSSRILLAEDVSNISACKGWKNSVDPDDDQGLIIGYIRDGAVYYRNYSYSSQIGDKAWGLEQQVTALGSSNSSLALIRTNDFRIGFMTEQNGEIAMALSKRTYPGSSMKPEYVQVSASASFSHVPIRYKYGYCEESACFESLKTFFCMDDGQNDISVVSAERIFSSDEENNLYCSGAKVVLSKALLTPLPSAFISGCSVSSSKLSLVSVSYDAEEQALLYSFNWKSGYTPDQHPVAFTVSFPTDYDLTYAPIPGQLWYVEGKSATLEKITIDRFANDAENVSLSATAGFQYAATDKTYVQSPDALTLSVAPAFSFVAAGDIPV